MTDTVHLDTDQLVRFLDGEQPASDAVAARSHLAACAVCREKWNQLSRLTSGIEATVASASVSGSAQSRKRLVAALNSGSSPAGRRTATATNRYWGWSMAAAAILALGLMLSPMLKRATQKSAVQRPVPQVASIDVNGEDFVTLPYSNPDLPMTTPRIVEMRIPVASLESAGIMTESVMSSGLAEQTVRANVLLGIDGQPLGIHVLSSD